MNLIKEMEELCFKNHLSEEEISKIGSCGFGAVYVHKINNVHVGYYILLERKTHIKLVSLGVLPEFRGQGIGRILLDKVKEYLDCQRKKIIVNVDDGDFEAQQFLKHVGFIGHNAVEMKDYYIFEWDQK